MKIIPYSDEALLEALEVLRSGGVIAHATETCYGLACDLSNLETVEKLFAIKQRPPHQPVSALFASIEQAEKYVEWNNKAEELAEKYLPGPLTMILPMRGHAPKKLFPAATPAALTTLGVRISSHTIAQLLVKAFESPLSTTSANIHGRPNPYSTEEIVRQFGNNDIQPDLVLDSGILPQTPPSTVIDLTSGLMEKRREGGLQI